VNVGSYEHQSICNFARMKEDSFFENKKGTNYSISLLICDVFEFTIFFFFFFSCVATLHHTIRAAF